MAEAYDTPVMDKAKASAGGDSAEVDAARDMLAAYKANDAKALSLALKRHYEACYGDDDSEDKD